MRPRRRPGPRWRGSGGGRRRLAALVHAHQLHILPRIGHADARGPERIPDAEEHLALDIAQPRLGVDDPIAQFVLDRALAEGGDPHRRFGMRSEEHTSELQSLMRISYAVFCLKKKKKMNTKRQ